MAGSLNAPRRRGRPPGGGNTSEQARELLLDVAEESFIKRGFRASTMQVIASDAGYTRAVVYRHFSSRNELLDALVVRVALRNIAAIVSRLGGLPDIEAIVVESLVIVSTELAHDPLLAVISERTEDGSVADLIVRSPQLNAMLTSMYEVAFAQVGDGYLRTGLRPGDAGRYVLSVALSLMLGVAPGADDPEQVRRFVTVFVLPALFARHQPAGPVFPPL